MPGFGDWRGIELGERGSRGGCGMCLDWYWEVVHEMGRGSGDVGGLGIWRLLDGED